MKVDLSLKNKVLYKGCTVEEIAGRLVLTTPVAEAINIVGHNISDICEYTDLWNDKINRDEITLTGPMAVWAYLVVFHIVVHKYTRVYYDDGRNGPILVAAHG